MNQPGVAPLVGAWIEILSGTPLAISLSVAPLVGAWIEICRCNYVVIQWKSLLSWERGLKYFLRMCQGYVIQSLLSWERGLKSMKKTKGAVVFTVAPLVGAWIEIRLFIHLTTDAAVSLLSWERGLK